MGYNSRYIPFLHHTKTLIFMKVIASVILKGGVGKTTGSLQIAGKLGELGNNVLFIDLDSQCNSTTVLVGQLPAKDTVFEMFLTQAAVTPIDTHFKGVKLIPASKKLNRVDAALNGEENTLSILKQLLKEHYTSFDYVVIDCPPSSTLLSKNALVASDLVLSPLDASEFSIQALIDLRALIKHYKSNGTMDVSVISKAYKVRFEVRTQQDQFIIKQVSKLLGDDLLNTHIRKNVAIKESMLNRETVYSYDPESHGANDFNQLVDEIRELL